MKSINRSSVVAVALGAVLSSAAFAQNPGGQNPGTGGTSPDPTNETPATDASGVRTGADPRVGTRYGVDGNADVNTNAELNTIRDEDSIRKDAAAAEQEIPPAKHKRSFWDRLLGRNKDGDRKVLESGVKTDASGRRSDAVDVQP